MQISASSSYSMPLPPLRTTASPGAPASPTAQSQSTELTPDEQATIRDLASRDREVKAHEAAHAAAGGAHVRGGPSFTYQTGPDGKKYAVGGEVSIDTSAVKGDPSATIAKMDQVIAAANAPACPSGQDRSVAAAAAQTKAAAQSDLAELKAAEQPGSESTAATSETYSKQMCLGYDRHAIGLSASVSPSINFSV